MRLHRILRLHERQHAEQRDDIPGPEADPRSAERNAFFPSPYSLSQYTASRTDFDGLATDETYTGGRRILTIAADERYMPMRSGTFFSTGNHPVETLLPIHHMHEAGYGIDVASTSGGPAAPLAGGIGRSTTPFAGYRITSFPDSPDFGANLEIGYLPGEMPWRLGEALTEQGIEIINDGMTRATPRDRNLLTGDSPLAANQSGKDAVSALLEDFSS